MKKLISVILTLCLFSNFAFADCDFSKGITKLPDGNYEYSLECHLKVGQLVQDSAVKDKQIQDLTTALDLKNAALTIADQRVALWEKTSDDELSRLNTMESDQHHDNTLAFALGVATTFLAAYAAGQVIHR